MTHHPLLLVMLLVMPLATTAVPAAESRIQLRNAPGKATVEAQCPICHSLDEIQINSPFLDRAGWTTEVDKMIRVMGAPIDASDRDAIINYLSASYGTGK